MKEVLVVLLFSRPAVFADASGGTAVSCGGPAEFQGCCPQCVGDESTEPPAKSSGRASPHQTGGHCHGITATEHAHTELPYL